MSENESPNAKPSVRKLKQTTLVFTRNKGITIDSKPLKPPKNRSKTKMSSNKRLRKEEKASTSDKRREPTPEPIPDVDPRLIDDEEVVELNSDVHIIDEQIEHKLPLDINLILMEDCTDNNPIVSAMKTIDELKEEVISMELVLDEHFYNDVSDDELEESTNASNADFEVEAIYDSKMKEDRLTYYSVKWKNWSTQYNTWEPFSNLLNCRQSVDEFRYIKNMCSDKMSVYRNYYKLKGIIEDVVEKKISSDVMISILLVFNDISLKEFNYTKALVNKLRTELRATHLSQIDKISETKTVDKRVEKLCQHFERLLTDLNICKRFENFELFSEYFIKRKQLELRLKRWENEINEIITKQKEGQTIRVENHIDCEVPPPNFEYISKCKTLDPNINISDDPPVYCECTDCETQVSETECCVASNTSSIQYTKNGILRDSRNTVINAIYECNKRCKCDTNCINRVVQNGRKVCNTSFQTI